MIGSVAERDSALRERIKRTGLTLVLFSIAIFLASTGLIMMRWWNR